MALFGAAPRPTVFGCNVQPCDQGGDHDWHSNGVTICPGIPLWGKRTDTPALVAGAGFAPKVDQ